jgi:hypothetical protein
MTATQATAKTANPAEPQTNTANGRTAVTVALQEPIKRSGGDVGSVQLMKPRVGDLRGLSLSELLVCQADAMAVLLPRITVPTLIKQEVEAMDPADFVACSAEVVDFLTPQAARAYQTA